MAPPAKEPTPYDAILALDNQFCFALHAASRLVVRSYRPLLEELELTYPQYLLMLVLWEWQHTGEERPTVSALGERLLLDSGTLTPLLRRLAQKNYLVRERSSKDERELFVRVTEQGLALRERARFVPLSLLRNSPFPLPETLQLRDQLIKLRHGLQAHEAVQNAL